MVKLDEGKVLKEKSLIVQKYGGNSVSTLQRIKKIAKHIIKEKNKGKKVVAVVSARGDTTDRLIKEAYRINPSPSGRELDALLATGENQSAALLALAILAEKEKAVSFNASQIEIITDSSHTKARIKRISTERLFSALNEGNIVVVAGFQGITEDGAITTLGRGGSDTTAVALAYVLGGKRCEIYTDVDGVYTSDPQIVKKAKKLKRLTYEEMLELASAGAKVLQTRAVELAMRFGIELYVSSSSKPEKVGTIITSEMNIKRDRGEIAKYQKVEEVVISGVTLDKDEAKITIKGVPDKPGVAGLLFSKLAEKNINIDMIVQSEAYDGKNDISFTVNESDLEAALETTKSVAEELGAKEVGADRDVAKISIVGVGMRSQPGVAAKMFSTLGKENINIEMISTSEIKISCIIRKIHGETALRSLHQAFLE
jgi:aspartate kinase